MKRPVVLILVDGMRPDALLECGHPYVKTLIDSGTSTMSAKTVMPSVTLPCHISLFHSVTPERHGILTNTYVPQVRPVDGICEQLHSAGRSCSFFYNWEQLRDLSHPGNMSYSFYVSQYEYEHSNETVTDAVIKYISDGGSDFIFVYLGEADEVGHDHGWMSDPYIKSVRDSVECIRRIMESLPKDAAAIITADHGGHDRGHGSDIPEDMTIPLILCGEPFEAGKKLVDACILDIAPTVTELLEVEKNQYWEGKSLI